MGTSFVFRGWTYAITTIILLLTTISVKGYLTTSCYLGIGCDASLMDRSWFLKLLPIIKISTMALPLKVCSIESSQHELVVFVLIPIYFLRFNLNPEKMYTRIDQEHQLVEAFKANILVRNDIIGPEEISIDISNISALITSCAVTILINARYRGHLIQPKVLSATITTFPLYTKVLMPIHRLLLRDDRDFFCQPASHPSFNMYTHLLDYTNTKVVIFNNSN